MTPSKALILSVGSIGNLNREANPRSLGGLLVDLNLHGDGAVKSQQFAAKNRILVDKNGAGSPKMRL